MKTPAVLVLVTVVAVTCLYIASHVFTTDDRRDDVIIYASSSRLTSPEGSHLPVITRGMLKFENESANFLKMLQEKYGSVRYTGIKPRDITLTKQEEAAVSKCISTAKSDYAKSNSIFWGAKEHIRTQNHTYLKRDDAVLIEVGGNQGDDATRFVDLFNPRYIILEPLEQYASILKKKFQDNSRVTVVNLGLGEKTEVVMVNIEGNNACATSKFTGKGGETPLFVVNATEYLMKLGLGTFDVDLMTLNCEGCEFETLETILSTSLIDHFRNIQFATHSQIPVKDPLPRYCRIQALLARTHRPVYQYKVLWESWRRKDLP